MVPPDFHEKIYSLEVHIFDVVLMQATSKGKGVKRVASISQVIPGYRRKTKRCCYELNKIRLLLLIIAMHYIFLSSSQWGLWAVFALFSPLGPTIAYMLPQCRSKPQGEAIWEKPAELTPKAEIAGGVGGAPHFENPEEWVCFLDETSGEEYWFNLTTGETHWDSK